MGAAMLLPSKRGLSSKVEPLFDIEKTGERYLQSLLTTNLIRSCSSAEEQRFTKPLVAGSNPAGSANFKAPIVYVVRTSGFQPEELGANPGGGAFFKSLRGPISRGVRMRF